MTQYYSSVVSSAALDDPEDYLSRLYGRASFNYEQSQFMQTIGGDERFQIASATFSGRFECETTFNDPIVSAARAPAPWEIGRDSGDMAAAPVLVTPGTPLRFATDRMTQAFIVNSGALERTARLLYARDDLTVKFSGHAPVNDAAAQRLFGLVQMVADQQARGLLANDLVRASTYQLLAVSALESFRLRADRRELRLSANRRAQIFRVASNFIHDFASLPITIDDIAEAADTSVPDLILAFRAHTLDETRPTTYLRRVRLEAARQDLIDADPTLGDTVRKIALRWGFTSPGSFAAHFRHAFGVTPKRVLDR